MGRYLLTMEKSVGFTEFGHLGNTYTEVAPCGGTTEWIPGEKLRKQCPFDASPLSYSSFDNTLTPVARVERYKNWIRQLCNRGGYCYLILFKRKYRPYAFLLYGKNPQLGDLNLDLEYRSEVFKDLNIAVNYEKKLIHVYRAVNVVYAKGFEKYKDNMELIDNWWLPHYIVGATQIDTQRRTDIQPEGSINPEIHHRSDYVHRPESSASQARHIRDSTDPRRPDRTYINSLMTGGMTAIQGHMTSLQEQEIKKERDHYKKKVERLEKKYGKKPAGSRPSTLGRSSDSGSTDPRSYLFDSGGPSEPNTEEYE